MAYLDGSGVHLYYESYGTHGPWVTLVNGHTRTSSDFRLMAKKLIEGGFRVLTFDNRGAGKTRTDSPFSIDDMSCDVLALWDELGIGTSALLGISMGGLISQMTALRRPQRVSSLCLISTFAEEKAARVEDVDWGTTIEETTAALKPYFSTSFFRQNQLLVKAMAKQILLQVNQGGFSVMAGEQKRALRSFSFTSLKLEKITCPTLIIHGDEDSIIDFSCAEFLHNSIFNSRLITYKGAGHLLLAERPSQLYEDVLNYLSLH
ncbi:MAG: alpha/beta hydrolase [Bdellovibrionota bacterium]